MARRILDHKCGVLNEALELEACDEPGPGGANHLYSIGVPSKDAPEGLKWQVLRFQKGGMIQAGGVNGISNEILLAVVMDRLRGFQAGPFRCRENALALTKIEEAVHWLQHRNRARAAAGVEGVHAPLPPDVPLANVAAVEVVDKDVAIIEPAP